MKKPLTLLKEKICKNLILIILMIFAVLSLLILNCKILEPKINFWNHTFFLSLFIIIYNGYKIVFKKSKQPILFFSLGIFTVIFIHELSKIFAKIGGN